MRSRLDLDCGRDCPGDRVQMYIPAQYKMIDRVVDAQAVLPVLGDLLGDQPLMCADVFKHGLFHVAQGVLLAMVDRTDGFLFPAKDATDKTKELHGCALVGNSYTHTQGFLLADMVFPLITSQYSRYAWSAGP